MGHNRPFDVPRIPSPNCPSAPLPKTYTSPPMGVVGVLPTGISSSLRSISYVQFEQGMVGLIDGLVLRVGVNGRG